MKEKTHCSTAAVCSLLWRGTSRGAKLIFMFTTREEKKTKALQWRRRRRVSRVGPKSALLVSPPSLPIDRLISETQCRVWFLNPYLSHTSETFDPVRNGYTQSFKQVEQGKRSCLKEALILLLPCLSSCSVRRSALALLCNVLVFKAVKAAPSGWAIKQLHLSVKKGSDNGRLTQFLSHVLLISASKSF